ncbi:MAG: DNA polymerase II, partial [Aeromonas sp.]
MPAMNPSDTLPADLPGEGFILTRHARDHGGHTELVLWLWSRSGPVRLVIRDQEPLFFIPDSERDDAMTLFRAHGVRGRVRRLPLQTFDGRAVAGVYFSTLAAFHKAIELLLIKGIEHFEADIRLAERYLMERFITAGVRFEGASKRRAGYWEVSDGRCAPAEVTPALSWVSLDVECAMDGALFSVGLS